jgi:MFS family permease
MALYVVYAVATYILVVVFNMFIPHCMRTAGAIHASSSSQQTFSDEAKTPITIEANTLVDGKKTSTPRKYGFKMSIWGAISTAVGVILALVVVIILSQTLPGPEGQSSGLLVTTVVGFLTIAGSIVTYLGLPAIPTKPKKDWKAWWSEVFTPLKDLLQRRNMAVLLLSSTIYTDTVFALSSVTSQLYFVEVKPDTLEYSLYSMAFNIFGVVTTLGFYIWQIWRPPFSLEYWLAIGYGLILIISIWGCIGLAENINFGCKVIIPLTLLRLLELTLCSFTEPLGILRPELYIQPFRFDRQFCVPRPLLGVGAERKRDRVVRVASGIVVCDGT